MKRSRIGTVSLPGQRTTLTYYVFGCRQEGYGLEIIGETDGVTICEQCSHLTNQLVEILSFGKAVVRGTVFPGFLAELAEEWEF
jgi:hypothetical protein